MIADIETRRGIKLKDIDQDSTWINGFKWMHEEKQNFPMKPINQLKRQETEMKEIQNEIPLHSSRNKKNEIFYYAKEKQNKNIPTEVTERFVYSNYLIDPNRHRFGTVVRIMAYVLKFVNFTKTKQKLKNQIKTHIKKILKNVINLLNYRVKISKHQKIISSVKQVKKLSILLTKVTTKNSPENKMVLSNMLVES